MAYCRRSETAVDSALHTFWTCTCNNFEDNKVIRNTQHLIGQAQEGCLDEPVFWLRGLLPAHRYKVPGRFFQSIGIDSNRRIKTINLTMDDIIGM